MVDCVLTAFQRFYQKNQKDGGRLAKLLLLLSPVKNIAADLLEELFFPGMVGSVKIDSVIPYILTMGEGVGQYKHAIDNSNLMQTRVCNTLSSEKQ